MFANLVDILKMDVVDKHNRVMGRPYDFLVDLGGAYPLLSDLVLCRGVFSRNFTLVSWSQVKRLEHNISLNIAEETLRFGADYKKEGYTSIRRGILDQQVVDTFNRKVVRVNDIHLLKVEKDLRIAHVSVGIRSLLRRMGWEATVDFFVRLFWPRSRYLSREQLISWKFVQPLDVVSKGGTIHLNVSQEDLAAIPPADLSEIIGELDPPERIALFRSFDFETQVDVLNELEVGMQRDLIEELDIQTAIRLLEKMDSDELADLLGALSKGEANRILSLISPVKARKLCSLLKYESDSAGGLMTTYFISLTPEMTVGESIAKISGAELGIEKICYAYVLDGEGHLEGIVTFKQLLTSEPHVRVGDIMTGRPISVPVDIPAKEVAFLMDKYDFLAVPVVDEGKVKGIITIDDILALAIDEAWGGKPRLL